MTAAGLVPTSTPTAARAAGVAPVTAVVVSPGRTPWLERTLAGLAAQTRLPEQVLLVDVGGPDGSVELLDSALLTAPPGVQVAHTRVVAADLGSAVGAGLAKLDAAGRPASRWLWLLHDDSAPAPDALAELVRAVGQAPSVAVAGVKQRTWDDPERLVEVGVRTTRSGRRITDVLPGELDQGQHDARTDVLGVGTAGALVRRDVWDALAGTDAALGPFGDGLDLSRRARLAGHRVVVVPAAVVRHARAGYLGLRAGADADPERSLAARRRCAVHLRLVWAPLPLLPLVLLAALLAAPVRALGRLTTAWPRLASAELRGGWAALLHPGAVLSGRRTARRTTRLARRTLVPLQARWRDVWASTAERRAARVADGTPEPGSADRPVAAELELGEARAATRRRRAGLGVLVVGLAAVLVLGFGSTLTGVIGGGRLVGGALTFSSVPFDRLREAAVSGWVDAGLGSAAPADPVLRVLTVAAALLGGRPALAVGLLLLGGAVLAGWGAWVAAGAATRAVGLRLWAAATWATAPTLLVAVGSGRLGAVLVAVGLPWAAFGLARALGVARRDVVLSGLATLAPVASVQPAAEEPGDGGAIRSEPVRSGEARVLGGGAAVRSVPALAGAALATALVLAGAPVLTLPVLLALAVVAVAAGRRGARLALVPLPGLVLLGPLLVAAVRRGGEGWRLLATDPGLATAAPAAGTFHRLLGIPVSGLSGTAPSWLPSALAGWWAGLPGALLLVLAAAALLRGRPVAGAVRVGWLVAAVGLSGATLAAALATQAADGSVGPAYLGPLLALAQAGLLTAALLGADGVTARLAGHTFGWRQSAVALAAVLAVLVTGVGATGWARRADVPATAALTSASGRVVPAVGQQAFDPPAGSRVLALTAPADGEPLRWTLLTSDGAAITDDAAAVTAAALASDGEPASDAAGAEVSSLAVALATGGSTDAAGALSALAVAHVLVPALPAGTDPLSAAGGARTDLLAELDATAGLSRVTDGEQGTLWRVAAAQGDASVVTTWARLVDVGSTGATAAGTTTAVASDGRSVDTTLSAGTAARVLVLASRSAAGWTATLDGHPLAVADQGWRAGFAVPAGASGHLVVRYADPARHWWTGAQLAVGGLVLLVAVPWRRRRRRVS